MCMQCANPILRYGNGKAKRKFHEKFTDEMKLVWTFYFCVFFFILGCRHPIYEYVYVCIFAIMQVLELSKEWPRILDEYIKIILVLSECVMDDMYFDLSEMFGSSSMNANQKNY